MNQQLYNCVVTEKAHRAYRREAPPMAEEFAAGWLPAEERMVRRFERLCALQEPVFLPEERICLLRTTGRLPDVFTEEEWTLIRQEMYVHESGYRSNLTADYGALLREGLDACYARADACGKRALRALFDLTERYRQAAVAAGKTEIAQTLSVVPHRPPESFLQALQFVRIVNFALWLEGDYHNTLGRFDRYMLPYLERDMQCGALTEEEALSLVEEFFLSLNRDSDLYPGIQQGDDGQSLMLGGRDRVGEGGFNRLSFLCLEASRNLRLIDPKINVRVDRNTPEEIYTRCTELTAVGLGFPQYSNDDVVIPGLVRLGYAYEDAVEYTVAACWEFIVPGVGEDIPNIAALSLPGVVDVCLHRDLPSCADYPAFLACVKREVQAECDSICDGIGEVFAMPSPLMQMFLRPAGGAPRYRNFGMHGVGLSTAADSLTAIREWVFEKRAVSPAALIAAVDTDFADAPELLHRLRYESGKLGTDSAAAEENLRILLDAFSGALAGKRNVYGGVWRAGTGSAMFYLWYADRLGASPDGRRRGEPFSANYSVSLFAPVKGPFAALRAMTAPDLIRTVNGGPMTVEFHSSVFATPESVRAVGEYVRQFILHGGHQLQLNAVSAETLRDAQAHPEKYPLLVVRIWGWSAYFTELDRAYQDHVIARQEYRL